MVAGNLGRKTVGNPTVVRTGGMESAERKGVTEVDQEERDPRTAQGPVGRGGRAMGNLNPGTVSYCLKDSWGVMG